MGNFFTISFCLISVTDRRMCNNRFSGSFIASLGTVMVSASFETLKTKGAQKILLCLNYIGR